MKTLKFTGYSDDTFMEYGVTHEDYDTCAGDKPVQVKVSASNGELFVVGQYGNTPVGGCWTIGVSVADEDIPLPDWSMRFVEGECSYSPVLEIDAPNNAGLTWYYDGKPVQEVSN